MEIDFPGQCPFWRPLLCESRIVPNMIHIYIIRSPIEYISPTGKQEKI